MASFNHNGTQIVTTSKSTAQVWDLATGKDLIRFVHDKPIRSATLSLNGTKVITTSVNTTAWVWDVVTSKELARFPHEDRVESAALSPDGIKVVTASKDRTARVWDVTTGKHLAHLAHEGPVLLAAFTSDGTKVVTASFDTTAWVWDVHWLTQHHNRKWIERICQEKLVGAGHITKRDVEISPLLSGREGEDVCDPPSWFSQLARSLGFGPKSGTHPN